MKNETLFMLGLVDEFKAFVESSMNDGIHKDYDDHFAFLNACMEVFQDVKENETEWNFEIYKALCINLAGGFRKNYGSNHDFLELAKHALMQKHGLKEFIKYKLGCDNESGRLSDDIAKAMGK